MEKMSSYERIKNILKRKPVDRIGLLEHFWEDTQKVWTEQGHIKEEESLADHFGFDIEMNWPFNCVANLDFEPEVIEETEDTVLTLDGNGAMLRTHKKHDTTPEHVDFTVKDRKKWQEYKEMLKPDKKRINFEEYKNIKKKAKEKNKFFVWSGVNVFEQMHPLCGHENLLMGMALDPDWVKDMVHTYSGLTIDLMEILFSEEGPPDGIWFYEDLGFKNKPFMSTAMYKEIIQPGHKKTIDYVKTRRLPVIMHSCGYVEPLVPGII